MTTKIQVKQVKSVIGHSDNIRRVVRGLGLKAIGDVKVHKDNNCIRGMINKVKHIVSFELVK